MRDVLLGNLLLQGVVVAKSVALLSQFGQGIVAELAMQQVLLRLLGTSANLAIPLVLGILS